MDKYRTIREKLEAELAAIMGKNIAIKSSTLLQAYATFASMSALDESNFATAYKLVQKENKACKWAILRGLPKGIPEEYPPVFNSFIEILPADFFRFVVPDLVGDPFQFNRFFSEQYDDNLMLCVHHIIQVKLVAYSIKPAEITDSTYEGAVNKLYAAYEKNEDDESVKLSREKFFALYKLLNLHPLDFRESNLTRRGYDDKNLFSAVDMLTNQLDLSREQQVEVLYRHYILKEQPDQIIDGYPPFRFAKTKDLYERKTIMYKAIRAVAVVPPLDALSLVSLYKKTTHRPSEHAYIQNDVPLENGLIYTLFTSRTLYDATDDTEFFVLFPSPFFVQKWVSDSATKGKKVSFVFENEHASELIDYHFREGTYAGEPGENVQFLSFGQWQKKCLTDVGCGVYLVFAGGIAPVLQAAMYRKIKRSASRAEIFAVLSSYEFEQLKSPFSEELDDPHINISVVETIPQGINNSTSPHRKMFLRCTYDSGSVSASPTKIVAYTLNTDFKTQALSRMPVEPIECRQQDLIGLYSSIRRLYQKELLARKASGRKNVAAFPHEFTPDITIWSSKTYPSNNLNRPRLEAYVCYPTDPKRIEDGYRERGTAIKETKKHTTKIENQDVSKWLEQTYPFSVVRPRYTKKELEDMDSGTYSLKPEISIRDEIITNLGPYLNGKNIALKTLWYLYPNLENFFSAKNYAILSEMMCAEMGFIRVGDITPETCEENLQLYYPDETREQLMHRFSIISVVLDKAVYYSYCDWNPLAQVVRDKANRDKLFTQVRRALAKKHFTAAELRRVFAAIVDKINEGKLEYLGVMLRLLTGLESNVICALKWKDVRFISDYNFSQIVVTRQVTNDGMTIKGFESLEDYLCFPCTLLLSSFLHKQAIWLKEVVPDWVNYGDLPIVCTRENLLDANRRDKMFAPRELEKLCKEIIMSVGIDDRIVELPDKESGTKETNLNRYGGDFFRENFRYWAVKEAGLSQDEVLYLLGNKPATTFGTFYCDYLNDASQLILFVKLLRLDAFLSTNRNGYAKTYEFSVNGRYEHTFQPITNRPLHLHIRMRTQDISTRGFSVSANSPYGLTGLMSPILPDDEEKEV